MAGVRLKSPDALQNTRGGRGRGVRVGVRPPGWKVPRLPDSVTRPLADGVQAKLQPAATAHARRIWKAWWSSAPSLAVDMASDLEAIEWWILCVFRRHLYAGIVLQQPMVRGSTGQPVVNPLEATVARLTSDIDRLADRFGMTTLSRFRLHFEAGTGGDGAADDDAERAYREMLEVGR